MDQVVELMYRRDAVDRQRGGLQEDLMNLLAKMIPSQIEFRTEQQAQEIVNAAKKRGVAGISVAGRIVRFAKQLMGMKETAFLLWRIASETLGLSGGFDVGAAAAVAVQAAATDTAAEE